MEDQNSSVADQIAKVVREFQFTSTGHLPKAVTVVLSDDTLVITLHQALSPAEQRLAESAQGAAQVQEFHRNLFAAASRTLREEIQKITGKIVRDAIAEVEPSTGAIVHAFTSGTVVQVYQLVNQPELEKVTNNRSNQHDQDGV